MAAIPADPMNRVLASEPHAMSSAKDRLAGPLRLHALPHSELRSHVLSRAAVSTTALALVDAHLPLSLLTLVLRGYLGYFRTLTGAQAIELYATHAQETALDRLGYRSRLVAFHVPWSKNVRHLRRLVSTSQSRLISATVHAYEWADCIHHSETGHWLADTPGALQSHLARTVPSEAELALLDEAANNQWVILFETVVDREFYGLLRTTNRSREAFLFHRLDFVRRLRDAWLAQNRNADADVPIGIVFNPWHAAIEMRGPAIIQELRDGRPVAEIRAGLASLLERFYTSMEDMVRRFYLGNSRPWELRLPEIVQRGHFLDPRGVIPEVDLLRRALRDQPELADAITLEAAPQAAVFSGRLALRS